MTNTLPDTVSLWAGMTEAGECNISCPLCYADTERERQQFGIHLRDDANRRLRLLCRACAHRHAPHLARFLPSPRVDAFTALMTPERPAKFLLVRVADVVESVTPETVEVTDAPPPEPVD